MKKIDTKNYLFLLLLLVGTVFITLIAANIYSSKNKLTSQFYESSKKITANEFSEYVIENPDTIIYISDKYDLTNETFEEKFKLKLEQLNLVDKFVFLDKDEFNETFLLDLNKEYKMDIDLEKTPVILVIIDKMVANIVYVDKYSNSETIINYGVFE